MSCSTLGRIRLFCYPNLLTLSHIKKIHVINHYHVRCFCQQNIWRQDYWNTSCLFPEIGSFGMILRILVAACPENPYSFQQTWIFMQQIHALLKVILVAISICYHRRALSFVIEWNIPCLPVFPWFSQNEKKKKRQIMSGCCRAVGLASAGLVVNQYL